MTPPEQRRRRFREQLHRNVGFIRRSCELFDQGHTDEGIRIATALRVLLYDTHSSTSLLSHLKVKDSMKLNSSCRVPPPADRIRWFEGMGRLTLRVDGKDIFRRLDPVLDYDAHPPTPLPIRQWWEMPVYVKDEFVTDAKGQFVMLDNDAPTTRRTCLERKDIILAAANKDGGAHVDAKLQPDYERLAASGALGMYTKEITLQDGTVAILPPLEEAHLVYLRQMGYEVLSSFDMRMLLVIR